MLRPRIFSTLMVCAGFALSEAAWGANGPPLVPPTADGWAKVKAHPSALRMAEQGKLNAPPARLSDSRGSSIRPALPPLPTEVVRDLRERKTPQHQAKETPVAPMARTLRQSSIHSYHRSLLPLTDHLENLSLAETADFADLKGTDHGGPWPEISPARWQGVLEPRLTELRRVVAHLREFRQPAAVGYAADLALAEWALTDAQVEGAYLMGENRVIPRLERQRQQLAVQHYRQTVFDYHVLGTGSLPELSSAVSLLNIAPRHEMTFQQAVARQSARWREEGAGIGRGDAVPVALMELGRTRIDAAQRTEDIREFSTQLLQSEKISHTLFVEQQQRFSRGTATLNQMTRTWQFRWQLHHVAERQGMQFPAETRATLDQELASLAKIARSERDLRGRNTADVVRVQLLTGLRSRETATETARR